VPVVEATKSMLEKEVLPRARRDTSAVFRETVMQELSVQVRRPTALPLPACLRAACLPHTCLFTTLTPLLPAFRTPACLPR
jgi:hypothetical protein